MSYLSKEYGTVYLSEDLEISKLNYYNTSMRESNRLISPRLPSASVDSFYSQKQVKYVIVTGGTLSGLGKGITISSLGLCLKSRGYNVTAIKIDPYLNIDAGTMSPFEHGEVFVLDDGEEVDLDLGNYERFLDINLNNSNSITTGKIYSEVINRERRGEYLGKTVQVIPHVTDYIQERLKVVGMTGYYDSSDKYCIPDICLVEVGGTVGDIESSVYLEALQQFLSNVGPENLIFCHVCYLPYVGGELKTKPTQHGVARLREVGLKPDFLFGRCELPLDDSCKNKLTVFTQVPKKNIISVHSVEHACCVVELLESQKVADKICEQLGLPIVEPRELMDKWNSYIEMIKLNDCANKDTDKLTDNYSSQIPKTDDPFVNGSVKIGIVGKYIASADTYLSVFEALKHASLYLKVRLKILWIESNQLEDDGDDDYDIDNRECGTSSKSESTWKMLRSVDGVLVPGGFGQRGINGKIAAINYCRTNNIPFLGICLGMQLAAIEFAKNVMNLPLAISQEFENEFSSICNPPITSIEDLTLFHQKSRSGKEEEILSQGTVSNLSSRSIHIVISMAEFCSSVKGGTMRLGGWNTVIRDKNSLAYKLYYQCNFPFSTTICHDTGEELYTIRERHRHRYEINPEFVSLMERHGLRFVGKDTDGEKNEILELPSHPFFIACQYHPEFTSRPMKPNPLFYGFILASLKKIQHNCGIYDFI
ncbi:CTP synthase family protein [Cryptosporidium andersoni]|uniref:CTP synthase n=1 Tax=Cryptosporidium andersoni TaxID=117008 RepID=A0A1J4MVE5_9CRYT|nr:CTP synthase family protein [Cryptosporidium andersoni]